MSSEKNNGGKYITPWLDLYSEQMNVRLNKRDQIEEHKLYRNDLKPDALAKDLHESYSEFSKVELQEKHEAEGKEYAVCGRIMVMRNFGKANFIKIDDGTDLIQLYVRKGEVSEEAFQDFKLMDYGDIVYGKGYIFKTNKGELGLWVNHVALLTKALRPLPEKYHGLTDPELKYRQRYLDMICNPDFRKTIETRAKIVRFIRKYFDDRGYLEVETPMLHTVAGGATARAFESFHNALEQPAYMRVAPELHLKRLIVGGVRKVYEMNRCFRNEGLSYKHNPEFTSIEFYSAYETYEDFIKLTEDMLVTLVRDIFQRDTLPYGDREINFKGPFKRLTMQEAVSQYCGISEAESKEREPLLGLLKKSSFEEEDYIKKSYGELLLLCFEEFVESKLIDPTFITHFPVEVSPLAQRNREQPHLTDRFELFVNGWEVANAFSELNNPTDQLERFSDQAKKKEAGDLEASDVDYDFVRALEYGMPPTAGEGIGIDRLIMLLTNTHTIRDVIIFPQLKKETFF